MGTLVQMSYTHIKSGYGDTPITPALVEKKENEGGFLQSLAKLES